MLFALLIVNILNLAFKPNDIARPVQVARIVMIRGLALVTPDIIPRVCVIPHIMCPVPSCGRPYFCAGPIDGKLVVVDAQAVSLGVPIHE